MITFESQETINNAHGHLLPKTETAIAKTTEVIQNLWRDTSLQIRILFQEAEEENPTLVYNHIYGVIDYEESDNEELVETAPTPSSEEKQLPTSRTIPKDWKDYSEKWFYSCPAGNEDS